MPKSILGEAVSNLIFASVWATLGDLYIRQLKEIVLTQSSGREGKYDVGVLNGILKVSMESGALKVKFCSYASKRCLSTQVP